MEDVLGEDRQQKTGGDGDPGRNPFLRPEEEEPGEQEDRQEGHRLEGEVLAGTEDVEYRAVGEQRNRYQVSHIGLEQLRRLEPAYQGDDREFVP